MHEWHDIRLTAGQHSGPGDGLCLMEAVALFSGERHCDWPACVCPVLIEFGRVLNDAMPDEWRTDLLLPLVPLLVGTRERGCTGDGLNPAPLERQRATMLVTWCLRTLPGWPIAHGSEEDQRRASALDEAEQNLRSGQAQHASRAAAAAVAWTAKGTSHWSLGGAITRVVSPRKAADEASRATLGVWQGAVDAYRGFALLDRPVLIAGVGVFSPTEPA